MDFIKVPISTGSCQPHLHSLLTSKTAGSDLIKEKKTAYCSVWLGLAFWMTFHYHGHTPSAVLLLAQSLPYQHHIVSLAEMYLWHLWGFIYFLFDTLLVSSGTAIWMITQDRHIDLPIHLSSTPFRISRLFLFSPKWLYPNKLPCIFSMAELCPSGFRPLCLLGCWAAAAGVLSPSLRHSNQSGFQRALYFKFIHFVCIDRYFGLICHNKLERMVPPVVGQQKFGSVSTK